MISTIELNAGPSASRRFTIALPQSEFAKPAAEIAAVFNGTLR
jgi:hypothetical protein